MRKIYIVMGYTGEYSSRSEWMVAAYFDKGLAESRAASCDRVASEAHAKCGRYGGGNWSKDPELAPRIEAVDPHMEIDYTGTSYAVSEVDIVDAQI